jgi:myo-inositol-1(or 4)-monophosphatase
LDDGLHAELELLTEAAAEAGRMAHGYFLKDPRSWMKAGNSPVSDADLAVDAYLAETLLKARPDYGWLSEETRDDPARLTRRRVFVVDPIDGTRVFLSGKREWVVSIATVEEGEPVAAILVAPALGQVFTATRGGGAFLDGVRLEVPPRSSLSRLRLAGPRKYLRPLAQEAGLEQDEIRFVGSLAYRLAGVATGRWHVAVGRPGARDWDLAAAHLLVAEAGGMLIGADGRIPRYNREETAHPAVIAAPAGLAEAARVSLALVE